MNKLFKIFSAGLLAAPLLSAAQRQALPANVLRQQLETITSHYKTTIGISLLDVEAGDTLNIHNDHHYPMQSVYKFPLAIAVLQQVDSGRFSLDQKIQISEKEMREDTWSPMKEKYPKGDVELTLSEILAYTVSQSDNNGCDILFRLMGGPAKVNECLRKMGVQEMNVVGTEDDMHHDWAIQYNNWSTPLAMVELLNNFYHKKYLTAASTDLLMNMMTESANSAKRIKGLLPVDIVVAHKTGSSGANKKGLNAATNDIGIITLPNRKHLAIVVFVSDTYEKLEANERIIAEISRISFDFWNMKGN